jgi:4-amino-4-deoxy-L-arabinose transferase-like glycosyltransferase
MGVIAVVAIGTWDKSPAGDGASVTAAQSWQRAFVAVFVIESLLKLMLAARLPLFADEAFYWQESRHLAWGYSDLPGLTAWMIRFGQTLAGEGALALRWPFLLVGALLPWLVVLWTRRHFGARRGWQAGLVALGLPLAGTLGVLALPDVVLATMAMLAVLALDRAIERDRWRDWLLLGVALLLAVASHYRAAMLLVAGAVFALATVRGRSLWRRPGWYLALAFGALGVVPVLIYNLGHQWAGLAFQAVERNPWRFHADALAQPLEQAFVCTPPLYALLLWAAWCSLRRVREGAPWDLAGTLAPVFLLGYFLGGLFADDLRFRLHWPLPGYLPLVAVLPALLAETRWRRGWLATAFAVLAVAQIVTFALLFAAVRGGDGGWMRDNGVGRAFAGWREAGVIASRQLHGDGATVLVADNFKLGAELDFALHGERPVYVLDSPANHKHGRAPQLRDWRLDQQALVDTHAGAPVLLAVEETSLREAQRPAWLGSICARFDGLQPVTRLDLPRMDRRIAFYRGRVRAAPLADPRGRDGCVVWRQYYAVVSAAMAAAGR